MGEISPTALVIKIDVRELKLLIRLDYKQNKTKATPCLLETMADPGIIPSSFFLEAFLYRG